MPHLDHLLQRLNLDPLARGLQIVDAHELARDFFPRLDTDRPALVLNLSTPELVRRVQLTLRVNYPSTHPITILRGETLEHLTLATWTPDVSTPEVLTLYLPPLSQPGSPLTLAALVARLRAPQGCPWDREQTHQSLRRALIEETYEVVEAITTKDWAALQEELGDLWLHVLFQTQIARERDEFALAEVGAELAAKLIRRHPHVFGSVEVANAQEVIANWERIKQEEKARQGKPRHTDRLDAHIPRHLPALARAQKIYERVRRERPVRFNKDRSLRQKIARARNRERALGEMLLALVGIAHEFEIDAESALRAATQRFVAKQK